MSFIVTKGFMSRQISTLISLKSSGFGNNAAIAAQSPDCCKCSNLKNSLVFLESFFLIKPSAIVDCEDGLLKSKTPAA